MNRPVRTRMQGGVGRAGERPALTRLGAFCFYTFNLCLPPIIQSHMRLVLLTRFQDVIPLLNAHSLFSAVAILFSATETFSSCCFKSAPLIIIFPIP